MAGVDEHRCAESGSCGQGIVRFVYRGVGITSDGAPGTKIELVPLPLFRSIPGTAEPGIVTIRGDPGLPDTSPAPREVLIPADGDTLGDSVAGGAKTAGGAPPGGGTCA
jgi:hypothetical protein